MEAFILRISLSDSEPEIYRKVAMPCISSLYDLHRTIQDCMGWMDTHLHEFIADGKHYGHEALGFEDDERQVPLKDLKGIDIHYIYDFGDMWQVDITWEEGSREVCLSPMLLEFRNESPVDDSGGMRGFYEIQEILKNPRHKDFKHISAWKKQFPSRTETSTKDNVEGYLVSGYDLADKLPAMPELVNDLYAAFLDDKGLIYFIDREKSMLLSFRPDDRSRAGNPSIDDVRKDPSRYREYIVTADDLNSASEEVMPVVGIKKPPFKDKAAFIKAIIRSVRYSKEDQWLIGITSVIIFNAVKKADMYIDYGYNLYMPNEIMFREMHITMGDMDG